MRPSEFKARWWIRWSSMWRIVGTLSACPSAGFAALEYPRGSYVTDELERRAALRRAQEVQHE